MSLVISDSVLISTRMSVRSFLHLLASREIPIHYDVAEFQEDLETLQREGEP